MRILAIDPGPKESACLIWNGRQVDKSSITANELLLSQLQWCNGSYVPYEAAAIEGVACYGMAVGKEVFETCIWIGRFWQAMNFEPRLIYRQQVKMHLCQSMRAKDANIRQALLDRFGGKHVAIGNKANPGVFYGVKSHLWSALALAVTAYDTQTQEVAAA